ncbi:hypothetical protein ACFC14_09905 [Microbacterium sp. NPDC055988]|uniref:hypothetical protein n=1 Tax=unclassified Microbacterium TaxID=2609290 RepID=UPI001F116B34|nr:MULTISPECIES: hypothetical protein [unclassified Microbacterium]
MMEHDPDRRFALVHVSDTDWAIHDLHYPEGDHRRVVCTIFEDAPTEFEVLWRRDLPLALRYCSAEEVLDAVRRFQDASRATRPIPIPHLPPTRNRGAGRSAPR